jgi:hypothetical protein
MSNGSGVRLKTSQLESYMIPVSSALIVGSFEIYALIFMVKGAFYFTSRSLEGPIVKLGSYVRVVSPVI